MTQSDGSALRIGVDFGGTKTEFVAMDAQGVVLSRMRAPTDSEAGYDAICANLKSMYGAVLDAVGGGEHTLGMGAPGATGPDGVHRTANPACLNGRKWREDLEALLGHPIEIQNDGLCFAMAEALHGAGRGKDLVFGATLGTGCGGGIVYRGEPISGSRSRAGEWGHLSLDPNGALCMCGRRGCAQTTISGRALEARYQDEFGATAQLSDIHAQSTQGDERATAFMRRFYQDFGRALANVVAVLDPDVIVLGGGVSNIDGLYTEGAREMARHLVPHTSPPPILRNELGETAGAIGAALIGC